MSSDTSENHRFALAVAAAWSSLERQLDCSLSAIRGVSFAEYRLLRALAEAPNGQASRIDAARSIGLTASGVTRALRPLEKIGLVSTVKNKRDARLAWLGSRTTSLLAVRSCESQGWDGPLPWNQTDVWQGRPRHWGRG